MAGELEQYIAHFQEADASFRKLKAALHDLSMKVTQAVQAPQVLAQPANGKWPTQDELRNMFVEYQQKAAPLQAEYNRLPQEYRQYAPGPNTLGHQ
jgi:hypothetical protein